MDGFGNPSYISLLPAISWPVGQIAKFPPKKENVRSYRSSVSQPISSFWRWALHCITDSTQSKKSITHFTRSW